MLGTGNKDSAGPSCKRGLLLLAVLVAACVGTLIAAKNRDVMGQEAMTPKTQVAEYEAAVPKTIEELQQFRQTSSNSIRSGEGTAGMVTLVNLNPTINAWYLLKVAWQHGSESAYHLKNPEPRSRKLMLDSKYPFGIVILEGKARYPCNLFGGGSTNALDQMRNSQLPYAPLCNGRLFLRNPVKGHRTSLEAGAEFFRKEVWGGEKVTMVFHHLLEDSHRETAKIHTEQQGGATAVNGEMQGVLPLPAFIDPKYAGRVVTPSGLAITLENSDLAGMRPGTWYPASGNPGIYVSLIEPELIDRAILESHKATVNTLGTVEAASLCYLVAFDLDRFDLAYSLGTEHPSVEWSEHIQPGMKDPKLPGPDGIGTISPLVSTGLVSPTYTQRTVATFTGGFKREHGAFKFGDFV